jgi:hypothetical protein
MTETGAEPVRSPDTKRRRTLADPGRILNETHFLEETIERLRAEFESNEPYAHVVLRDLYNHEVLRQARQELINNVDAKLKETDLFKVLHDSKSLQVL